MFLNKVQHITIFGGGTSGWLTAAYLVNNLQRPTKITLIEDTSLGPIGVGEGTQPLTSHFLSLCGIYPKDWMKSSDAAFKYGVELDGWTEEPYFVDNDSSDNTIIAEDFFITDYFISRPNKEFKDYHPAYRLAKQNICQKYDDYLDVNHRMGPMHFGAVHFNAYQILTTLKNIIGDRIEYVDTKITTVTKDENGIKELISDDGTAFTADLFIDCTGFKSILLEKELGVRFNSFNDHLLCDRAVVMPKQYTDPEKECHPYTKATAMNAGWRFTIPIFTRVGNGYVYSSKHISDEDAEAELREAINEHVAPARILKMKCGAHEKIAEKNVVAVGLSAGFVEPLEATGITFTTAAVMSVADLLNRTGNIWNTETKNLMNNGFKEMSQEIFTFVWAHYYFSTKDDTPFWKEVRGQKIEEMPQYVRDILSAFLPLPKRFLQLTPSSMFNVTQWFSMLHAGGAYNNVESYLTEKQTKYAEYFIKSNNARVDLAEEMFDNHYKYLKEWYDR
jgi:2-polyprenyl-6-methoxyphenol hydroxylase-like FAD-dependent oxidoreductase